MKTDTGARVVILGASDKPERFSYKAYQKLLQNGFTNLIGVSPKALTLAQLEVVSSLDDIKDEVNTLTLYVGENRLESMIESILALSPKRIITNPGTENSNLIKRAKEQGIEVVIGCTLILLDSGEF